VACDFFTVVTATFRVLYVFVALEIGSRRPVHFNPTEHPTAEWTLQQLREALLPYRQRLRRKRVLSLALLSGSALNVMARW
jgi:hypothetical protein